MAYSVDACIGNGDFTALDSEADYLRYFRQLRHVCRHLARCFSQEKEHERVEGAAVRDFLRRLEKTSELLQLKHAFRSRDGHPFWIDVSASGFPNHVELAELEADLGAREVMLQQLPPLALLKRTLADELFRSCVDPIALLNQLSRRTYLEALSPGAVFLPFTLGELAPIADPKAVGRRYLISFACHDFRTNRPYLNFLAFEQDAGEAPLEHREKNYEHLVSVLRAEGARAPEVGVLAMSIDESLERIHPKILKRICLGPLYSKVLLENRKPNGADAREAYFQELLLECSRRDDDFILVITEEVVFSARQSVTRSVFNPGGTTREVFSIPASEPECAARQASAVHHYFLAPHDLLQHFDPKREVQLDDFSRATKIALDDAGEVHGR